MSRVTDPLREYIAKTWDGSMYVNQVPMRMLEIADQIDTEHERLEQGNARLRELVRSMWPFAKSYLDMLPVLGINDTESHDIYLEIRKLRIEVDE